MDVSARFADALIKIAAKAKTDPGLLQNPPQKTKFGRMDEVKAAHELVLLAAGRLREPVTSDP